MTALVPVLVAVLSIWDYPARQPAHERLRDEFVHALNARDYEGMRRASEAGVRLLPDDPTWAFNQACALAHGTDSAAALDALERAIDLGFRDPKAIAGDADLRLLEADPRYRELVDYADRLKGLPVVMNPLYAVPAEGSSGVPLAIGEQNLTWDFDWGCFDAKVELAVGEGELAGELYFNRDGGHSMLAVTNWPGLTSVRIDRAGRERGAGLDFPDMLFRYPVFGNCSRGITREHSPVWWRSLPRAMMTTESRRLKLMGKLYLSNQFWVYPAVDDHPGFGTNGDVFASVTPYWLVTQGRSWSDQYYLRAALRASRSMKREVKRTVVERGLLAPTIQALIRKSLWAVKSEDDYLTPAAHPTAFPPSGLDLPRLVKSASELTVESVPPVAYVLKVSTPPVDPAPAVPELTYSTPCAWAYVLRAEKPVRTFFIKGAGARELAFVPVHDEKGLAKVEMFSADTAKVTIDRTGMTPTNRIDIGVFARAPGTGWGAPSFVSFAVVDPTAPYSDPYLTPARELPAETGPAEPPDEKAAE